MSRKAIRSLLLGAGTAAAVLTGALAPAANAAPAPDPAVPDRVAAVSTEDASAAGFWSCTVPSGYTYTNTQQTLSCSSSGFRTMYYVEEPRTGLWACTVPSGFTYTNTQQTLRCSSSGFRTLYYLRQV
ncbi:MULTISPECIES: hypothetical protein [unclassified Streptomyces]|uniref:hypothetical protein n=1 Tax=unclassified Streptomyces TaxID=2593676 RepID=UPI0019059EDC|nr:hypothetical protein [Streptomyces sp. HSG2]